MAGELNSRLTDPAAELSQRQEVNKLEASKSEASK